MKAVCSHNQPLKMPRGSVHLETKEGEWRLLNGVTLPMAQEVVNSHKQICESGEWLKNDIKRRVSRVTIGDNSFIVKEFCKDHAIPWLNHGHRTWIYSQKLTGLTAPCLAWLHENSGHGFLIFADLGQTDLFYPKQLERVDELPAAYHRAGGILAELHTHGIYHADTKTVNFVINDRLPWMSSPVLIIDCDDVHFHHSISKNHQVKNLVQFLALMGNLSHELITPLAADFKNGYQTTLKLSDTDMATLMAQVAERMKNDKSLENNLPSNA